MAFSGNETGSLSKIDRRLFLEVPAALHWSVDVDDPASTGFLVVTVGWLLPSGIRRERRFVVSATQNKEHADAWGVGPLGQDANNNNLDFEVLAVSVTGSLSYSWSLGLSPSVAP